MLCRVLAEAQYASMITELASGLCLAMEVRSDAMRSSKTLPGQVATWDRFAGTRGQRGAQVEGTLWTLRHRACQALAPQHHPGLLRCTHSECFRKQHLLTACGLEAAVSRPQQRAQCGPLHRSRRGASSRTLEGATEKVVGNFYAPASFFRRRCRVLQCIRWQP